MQENCTIHMFPGTTVILHKGAHISHGAVIHSAEIGENSLIGMNSVLMDNAKIGKECIVGVLSFVKAEMVMPNRSLIAGNPSKFIREISDKMIAWKSDGTKLYQQLPKECFDTLKPCEPLREAEPNRPFQMPVFKTCKTYPKKTSDLLYLHKLTVVSLN